MRCECSGGDLADGVVFVKGSEGFRVSTSADDDNLGDSAANQARRQYRSAPEYTIPPSGSEGGKGSWWSLAALTDLAPRATVALAGATAVFWMTVIAWAVAR